MTDCIIWHRTRIKHSLKKLWRAIVKIWMLQIIDYIYMLVTEKKNTLKYFLEKISKNI